MRNIVKLRKAFLSILLTAFGLLLVFGMQPNKVNAADESPFYNGTVNNLSPNSDTITANGLEHYVWMTADNGNGTEAQSNYGTVQPGIAHNFLIKNGNYQNLQLHLKLTNPSKTDTVTIMNECLDLPDAPDLKDAASSQVAYSGSGPVMPDTKVTSNPSSVHLWYDFTNHDGTDTNAPDLDWSKLYRVSVTSGNKLAPGQSIQINVPLTVTPDKNGNTSDFTFADLSYKVNVPTYIQNWARVASPIPLPYRQAGYEGYITAGQWQYSDRKIHFASDVQQYMPKIADSLNAIGYDNTNSADDGAPDDTVLYTGGNVMVHLDKLRSANGTESLADELHQNGYSLLIYDKDSGDKAGQELNTYVFHTTGGASTNPLLPNGFPAMGTKYNGKLLGPVEVTIQQLVAASNKTIPVTKDGTWNPYDGVTFYGTDQKPLATVPDSASYVVKKVDVNNNESAVANNKVDTTKDGVYHVTYTYVVNKYITVKKTVTITVGKGNPTPTPTPTPNNGGGSNNTNNGSSTSPVNNSTGNSTTTTTNEPAVPNYAAVKGSVVYATKGMYLYKNANFRKSQRIAKYSKAKRVNRPMFVVTGYVRSNNGTLRYKVRDVNHGKKTANKVGYITASRKYVVNVYYKTMPKNKKITVISKKGVHAYKNANLTGKAKTYKNGKHLRVRRIVKHNLTTRYQLSNGDYVTANKKLIIQGNY
ncbi:DUF5776 domain-containing protein [Lentilactobacillus kisonensis]|uniref:DUF5776 domain-containing protein n=2 Tax=Lentilactobacillus kisonensis TaxID=481722 RepID=UPI000704ABB4|nr:DUF5776 domain-containing protein [Lentilactobacillus kisonensis]